MHVFPSPSPPPVSSFLLVGLSQAMKQQLSVAQANVLPAWLPYQKSPLAPGSCQRTRPGSQDHF